MQGRIKCSDDKQKNDVKVTAEGIGYAGVNFKQNRCT